MTGNSARAAGVGDQPAEGLARARPADGQLAGARPADGQLVDGQLAQVRPRYGQASLADLLPSVLAVLGVPGSPDTLGLGVDRTGRAGPLAGVTAVAVLLVDGLGWAQLPLAMRHAGTLADLAAPDRGDRDRGDRDRAGQHWGDQDRSDRVRVLTASFPTTTPTSLVTFGTGVVPGEHGILGLRTRLPGTTELVEHLHWLDRPDPADWQPVPTQFERAVAAGVRASVVTRSAYRGSGLSVAATRGASFVGGTDVDALAGGMLDELNAPGRPALVYGYHPELDAAGHGHGVGSPQWRDAVTVLDRLVQRLAEALPPDSALLITADHGQLVVDGPTRIDVDHDARLRHGVRLVAGGPRVRYLHVEPGALADVQATWQGVLGDGGWVGERDEAIAAGWFGPVRPAHRERIGDLVVICRNRSVVVASLAERPSEASMVGYHGGATAAEMLVPLLILRG
jgi:type I phosphodiesterase/nucleotide pyrophosphatase